MIAEPHTWFAALATAMYVRAAAPHVTKVKTAVLKTAQPNMMPPHACPRPALNAKITTTLIAARTVAPIAQAIMYCFKDAMG
jgi:hypothetical protein